MSAGRQKSLKAYASQPSFSRSNVQTAGKIDRASLLFDEAMARNQTEPMAMKLQPPSFRRQDFSRKRPIDSSSAKTTPTYQNQTTISSKKDPFVFEPDSDSPPISRADNQSSITSKVSGVSLQSPPKLSKVSLPRTMSSPCKPEGERVIKRLIYEPPTECKTDLGKPIGISTADVKKPQVAAGASEQSNRPRIFAASRSRKVADNEQASAQPSVTVFDWDLKEQEDPSSGSTSASQPAQTQSNLSKLSTKSASFTSVSSVSSAGSSGLDRASTSGQRRVPVYLRKVNSSTEAVRKRVVQPANPLGTATTKLVVAPGTQQYYTVVRNVNQPHQTKARGDAQEFKDEMEYLLSSLTATTCYSVRSQSLVSLTEKCASPSFRTQLRRHGFVARVFRELADAPDDLTLALATSCIIYLLSRDKTTLPLDSGALELIFKLLTSDYCSLSSSSSGDCPVSGPSPPPSCLSSPPTSPHRQLRRDAVDCSPQSAAAKPSRAFASPRAKTAAKTLRDKLWGILDGWYKEVVEARPGAKIRFGITQERMTPRFMATEALCFIATSRNDDWFKAEMRRFRFLEHFVLELSVCCSYLQCHSQSLTDEVLSRLLVAERYLRIMEQVTVFCHMNQLVLTSFNNSSTLLGCSIVLQITLQHLEGALSPADASAKAALSRDTVDQLFACLCLVFKVLCNLTHNNELCCQKLGQDTSLIDRAMRVIFWSERFAPGEKKFDLLITALGFAINVTEHCSQNRRYLIGLMLDGFSVLESLADLFLRHSASASQAEEVMDVEKQAKQAIVHNASQQGSQDSGYGGEAASSKPSEPQSEELMTKQEMHELVNKALEKAGEHMEESFSAAYTALLIGCIIPSNDEAVKRVRSKLPNESFESMIELLRRFLVFMEQTAPDSAKANSIESMGKIIHNLEMLE